MGADLYITPLHQQQRQQWEPQFEEAVRRRNSFKTGSEEYRQAQAAVEECYEKLHEQGYFRDPYNSWDLLWKFGLSWWEDVIPMLDHHGRLSVAQVQSLLAMLNERENVFSLRLAELPAEDQRHFRRRYADLQKFLNQSIELNTPIDTSL
jgi:hypothetical protein